MAGRRTLSAQQKAFVKAFVAGVSQTDAARAAGYGKTAANAASKLMKNERVIAAIEEAKGEAVEALTDVGAINPDWLLQELVENYKRCMALVEPMLHSKARTQIRDGEGRPVYKYNAALALRFLTILGRHKDIDGFARNKPGQNEVNGETLFERVNAARRSIAKEQS